MQRKLAVESIHQLLRYWFEGKRDERRAVSCEKWSVEELWVWASVCARGVLVCKFGAINSRLQIETVHTSGEKLERQVRVLFLEALR